MGGFAEWGVSSNNSTLSTCGPPILLYCLSMHRSSISAVYQWSRLAQRVVALWHAGEGQTPSFVRDSYDAIAAEYDLTWTSHMRDLTQALLGRLSLGESSVCLDLTCGTGYATGQLQSAGAKQVIGVDAASGMLKVARQSYPGCRFVQADVLEFLRQQPDATFDVITCCWGLGYSKPRLVVRECSRLLRPGGQLGIIDNSLWSLREMIWTSIRAFSHHPEALTHAMRVRFLPSSRSLGAAMRQAGLHVDRRDQGERRYLAKSGREAIARLRSTGAAAGFEFAALPEHRDAVYATFASLLEERYGQEIPIVHRYIAAISRKGAI